MMEKTIATTAASSGKTNLRFQTSWPAGSLLQDFADDYANLVNDISGGLVSLEMLPAGAVAGPLQLQGAVASGTLDGGHTVASFQYGRNKAYSLFTTPPPFGWNSTHMLGWMRHGGGQKLYDELVQGIDGLDVVSYMSGPMPTQPLGWFDKPVLSPEDLKGLKYRTNGLSLDVCRVMGMQPVMVPPHEIVAAFESGLIDSGEFLNPTIDRQVGFPKVSKVYMIQGYHQVCECFEIMFNRSKLDSLGANVKAILRAAADAASADMLFKQMVLYPRDLLALREEDGVSVIKAPDSVLRAQLTAWREVIEELSGLDPYFKRVVASQMAWNREVIGFEMEWEVPRGPAFEYFISNHLTESGR